MARSAWILIAVQGLGAARGDEEEGFVRLFDRDHLPDWTQCGPGSFKIEDGPITCRGKRYQVRLNGKLVTDWNDTADRPLKGYVGIQNFPWPGAVRHRNVRIKELP